MNINNNKINKTNWPIIIIFIAFIICIIIINRSFNAKISNLIEQSNNQFYQYSKIGNYPLQISFDNQDVKNNSSKNDIYYKISYQDSVDNKLKEIICNEKSIQLLPNACVLFYNNETRIATVLCNKEFQIKRVDFQEQVDYRKDEIMKYILTKN